MYVKTVNARKNKQINTTNKIVIIRQKTKLNPKGPQWSRHPVAPGIAAALKIILLNCGKRTDFWHLVLLGEKSCLRSRHLVLWSLETLTGQQRFYGSGLVT
jgi:hypothetical protein